MWLAWSPLLLIYIKHLTDWGCFKDIHKQNNLTWFRVLVTSSPCSSEIPCHWQADRFSNITNMKAPSITMKASGRIRQAISWVIELSVCKNLQQLWSPTELWKKNNVQLRQAAPASDFSIIGFFPIRVQNIPEVIRTFFFHNSWRWPLFP